MSNEQTAGQKLATECAAFVRARKPFLWVESREEERVLRDLAGAFGGAGYRVLVYDGIRGVVELDGSPAILYRDRDGSTVDGLTFTIGDAKSPAKAPPQVLALIDRERERALDAQRKFLTLSPPVVAPVALAYEGGEVRVPLERIVWVLRDFDAFTRDPMIRRHLRNLAETLPLAPREGAHAIVVLSTSGEIPPDLADSVVHVKWSLPDRAELGAVLDAAVSGLPEAKRADAASNGTREASVEAAVGLSAKQAAAVFSKSLVLRGAKVDPALVAEEKRRIVASKKGLEWHDPDPRGLDAVGGLDVLKGWLTLRRKAFLPEARAYGLPLPKGVLCVGPPGTGKSLICKAIAAAWGFPLIRFDLPAMKGGIVGQSEAAIREAIAIVEAVGRCIVWIDELDKAIAPAGSIDGGTSADQLGALLTWMSDRKGAAFVVATANDVSRLPPELLRKGRWDELFVVDLPTTSERAEILAVTARKFKRDPAAIDARQIADATEGFTGSEIAACVEAALFAAFADGAREPVTADVIRAAHETVPQSRGASEQIKALRQWAKDRARPASRPDAVQIINPPAVGGTRGGDLDIDPN